MKAIGCVVRFFSAAADFLGTREFVERCDTYAATGIVTMMPIPLPG